MQQGREAAAVRPDGPRYGARYGAGGADTAPAGDRTEDASPAGVPGPRREVPRAYTAADIYQEVQSSAAFLEVRGRYRGFVVPAAIAFLTWYLAYVLAATLAPGLMAHPVAGAVNVAMIAGLAQFLTTFVLTWAYVRHARLNRDRAALELRWTVLDRGVGQDAGRGRAS
ncbi:DUF485 domain-containing protein [Streptomyces fuscigenes]|uniref:DUF485 domain-containing protein n=1 Tax=Streptomyces fuscigenes TaxID=1528880 RepID=UPI001F48F747|nr:DUF485 domain-containing protein [Streptomyces fuscigenes]MCF3962370.1 DUF485 domain-containing protein [Streptomyces fuscigenes]